ncbi:MAG TPA: rRNA maturation RNase YbeY [Ferruginibacter sp.]|nr:rRNA maturation RNase YbeY [Ferruginibacter sp.]
MIYISLINNDRTATLKNKLQLKKFIEKLFKNERTALNKLTYIFCSDKYLLQINKKFLNHNYYTDVITFYFNEPQNPIEGEVYISIDRVKENAKEQNSSFKRELHRVIFHAALHLCGYQDKRKQDILLMRTKENEYLNKYFPVK